METRTLYRSHSDKIIAGVCGGLGRYFDVDPVLVRIVFVVLAVTHGIGILFYLLLMFVVPKEPIQGEPVMPAEGDVPAETVKEEKNDSQESIRMGWLERRRNVVGLLIILIGLVALLSEIMPELINWSVFWPIVLILIGLSLIFKSKRHGRR